MTAILAYEVKNNIFHTIYNCVGDEENIKLPKNSPAWLKTLKDTMKAVEKSPHFATTLLNKLCVREASAKTTPLVFIAKREFKHIGLPAYRARIEREELTRSMTDRLQEID